MGKYIFLICFLVGFHKIQAQIEKDSIDINYLEDQIYLSLSYNILFNKSTNIAQNGFSGGFSTGFIKDIPFNNDRNIGLGIGLGYSYNAYIQNLKITRQNHITSFSIAENYNTNRFGISTVELPIEFRWRTSTPTKYKFWRIYGGFKFLYVLTSKSKYSDTNSTIVTKNIPEINRLQYGLIISSGYSNWNIHLYYGLKPLFKDVIFDGSKLNLKEFNVGLKFYIM
jgi:hypothetical protein